MRKVSIYIKGMDDPIWFQTPMTDSELYSLFTAQTEFVDLNGCGIRQSKILAWVSE